MKIKTAKEAEVWVKSHQIGRPLLLRKMGIKDSTYMSWVRNGKFPDWFYVIVEIIETGRVGGMLLKNENGGGE